MALRMPREFQVGYLEKTSLQKCTGTSCPGNGRVTIPRVQEMWRYSTYGLVDNTGCRWMAGLDVHSVFFQP